MRALATSTVSRRLGQLRAEALSLSPLFSSQLLDQALQLLNLCGGSGVCTSLCFESDVLQSTCLFGFVKLLLQIDDLKPRRPGGLVRVVRFGLRMLLARERACLPARPRCCGCC